MEPCRHVEGLHKGGCCSYYLFFGALALVFVFLIWAQLGFNCVVGCCVLKGLELGASQKPPKP